MHTYIGVALKPNFMSSLLHFLKYAFSTSTLKILNLYNESPKIYLCFRYVSAKMLSSSRYTMLNLFDDISSKTVRL